MVCVEGLTRGELTGMQSPSMRTKAKACRSCEVSYSGHCVSIDWIRSHLFMIQILDPLLSLPKTITVEFDHVSLVTELQFGLGQLLREVLNPFEQILEMIVSETSSLKAHWVAIQRSIRSSVRRGTCTNPTRLSASERPCCYRAYLAPEYHYSEPLRQSIESLVSGFHEEQKGSGAAER